jgi:hypothetical protein
VKAGVVIAVVVALVAGVGLGLHPELLRRAGQALGTGDSTPETGAALSKAGVHKCSGANGVLYLDHACPPGTREVAASGGAVTVMSFPAPPKPAASGPRLMQGMSPEEVDKFRDRMIEQAANR